MLSWKVREVDLEWALHPVLQFNSSEFVGSSLVAPQVEDPALALSWLGSLLWCRFSHWPGNFHMLQAQPKKKKRKNPRVF